jgi:hypothetical protein
MNPIVTRSFGVARPVRPKVLAGAISGIAAAANPVCSNARRVVRTDNFDWPFIE